PAPCYTYSTSAGDPASVAGIRVCNCAETLNQDGLYGFNIAELCQAPYAQVGATQRFDCVNSRTNNGVFAVDVISDDGRIYNTGVPRHGDGTLTVLDAPASWHLPTANTAACAEDATEQIASLARDSRCATGKMIGYAGSITLTGGRTVAVQGATGGPLCGGTGYAMRRNLYVCSLNFGATSGSQASLINYISNPSNLAAVNAVSTAEGFIPVTSVTTQLCQ
ncbi:MAG TPA: hypothetical protein VK524_15615, partial [Polyangiaceae bacterium]|nr:hypothetical protein [Polyangiaceae bacterium]